ncbi:MAG: OsmC family protein [Chitinophagaceae bacterium]|nr:OsmC family protein [Chitinophagaceae bacterium]MCB0740601.1 OsmC family protein [Chitinophagaceae bacterium]HQU57186.1 OsmC family protein [Chitinophagaceae bacterium]HQV05615.1 OsmC family protein [Chitinophagaceae bacterium]
MTSSVTYNEALRTTCTHLRSGSAIETDAPVDNNGKGERFSPTDLLATSIATCMLTVMGIKARSMHFDLNDMKIDVLKTMAADPRRVSRVDLTFHFPEALKKVDEKTKIILKNTATHCPVMMSINPAIEVVIDWNDWA